MNAFGAKGMGDGSSMLTPAAMANAVADALGRDDIVLPLTLQRVWSLANGRDPQAMRPAAAAKADRSIEARRADRTGRGRARRAAWKRCGGAWSIRRNWRPSFRDVEGSFRTGRTVTRREVVIGVAGIRGSYDAHIEMRDKQEGGRFAS